MTITAQDIITNAMYEGRYYAPGETVSAPDINQGLWVLNGMLDSWAIESLMCYAILEQSGTLVINQSAYPVGPAASFNATRPTRVITGPGAAYLQDNLGNNYPVEVIERDFWNLIGNRTTTSDIPDTMYYDPQFPQGIINVFPVPTQTYKLFWDSYLPLSQFPTLTTAVSLPQGYQDALQHNLCVRLKPFFKGSQLDPIIIELAAATKGVVKRNNIRAVEAVYDGEIIAKSSGTYNIYRDGRGSNG